MNFTLSNGINIPAIAFGTYNKNLNLVYDAVSNAIKIGYRHFDTATLYLNEKHVGSAINDALKLNKKLKRSDFFITTKLPMNGMNPEKIEYFLRKSLKNLNLNYLDLYLIHAPFAVKYQNDFSFYPVKKESLTLDSEDSDLLETWKVMEQMVFKKYTTSIGVSNFNERQIQNILDNCTIKPSVNQIECHVYFQNKKLVLFCQKNEILVSAFAPLGSPKKQLFLTGKSCLNDCILIAIAQKYKCSVSQIILKFLNNKGFCVIPSADNTYQSKENFLADQIKLEEDDMEAIEKLDKQERLFKFDHVKGILDHKDYPF